MSTQVYAKNLARTTQQADANFAAMGGAYQASAERYRKEITKKSDSILCEEAMALMPSLSETLEKAASAGRTSCEFVVGTYGHHGTFDRAGKTACAKKATFLISELKTQDPEIRVRRCIFGQKRDDLKAYRIFISWDHVEVGN